MSKLLLVEDDVGFAQSLITVLQESRFAVDHAVSAEDAVEFLNRFVYAVMIVDWELPAKSGPELCKLVKQNSNYGFPVLMLTARTGTSNTVVGLDAGADDYLAKPCNTDELIARIRALMRRSGSSAVSVLQHGELKMYEEEHRVEFFGQELSLSAREFELLRFFIKHPDTHFTSEAIFVRVWADRDDLSQELVRMYVKKLRDKLTAVSGKCPINTVAGSGYVLVSNLCER